MLFNKNAFLISFFLSVFPPFPSQEFTNTGDLNTATFYFYVFESSHGIKATMHWSVLCAFCSNYCSFVNRFQSVWSQTRSWVCPAGESEASEQWLPGLWNHHCGFSVYKSVPARSESSTCRQPGAQGWRYTGWNARIVLGKVLQLNFLLLERRKDLFFVVVGVWMH